MLSLIAIERVSLSNDFFVQMEVHAHSSPRGGVVLIQFFDTTTP